MKKRILSATTLLEVMITLAILAIATIYIINSPIFISNKAKLNNEAELFKSFIYQVQTLARNKQETYTVFIHSENKSRQNHWCIVAIRYSEREDKLSSCNCLNNHSCHITSPYFVYRNHFDTSNILFNLPKTSYFMRINGNSGNLETKCVKLTVEQESTIIGFDPYGVVNVPSQNKRSECNGL